MKKMKSKQANKKENIKSQKIKDEAIESEIEKMMGELDAEFANKKTDDCKGPLVNHCSCKDGNCTAHDEFETFSRDMQNIAKLKKAYGEEELKKIAQRMPKTEDEEVHLFDEEVSEADPMLSLGDQQQDNKGGMDKGIRSSR